jgi:aminopeptidase N
MTFYHQTVTTRQVEDYISTQSGKDFRKLFDQYLRTTNIPVLEYKQVGNAVQYRWANTVAGFDMPVKLTSGRWLQPTAGWRSVNLRVGEPFDVDRNFYINLRKL